MTGIRKTLFEMAVAVLLLALAGGAAAQDGTVPVTFAWAPCPSVDDQGQPLAEAVRYEVFVQRGGSDEELVAVVENDTTYVLAAERGVVQRVRVVGYDERDRPSPASDWSDPVFFEVQRSDDGVPEPAPTQPALMPNYPNPFNPETRIAYGVPEGTPDGARMALEIYNIRGQRVRAFDTDATPGWHEVTWDGRDDRGLPQSTGTYITRYICGDKVEVGKMTMVK
jgi:hypothetical protein